MKYCSVGDKICIVIMSFIFVFYAFTIIVPIADGDLLEFVRHIATCGFSLFAINYTLKETRK